jgi:hypothetical protein
LKSRVDRKLENLVRKDYWEVLGGSREDDIKMGPRRREVSIKGAEFDFLSD